MIRPVDAPLGQMFGDNPTRGNPDPVFGDYQPDGHTGQDYKCAAGTPIRAVTSGTVLHAGWMPGTYADNPWWIAPNFAGYCYVIDHGAFIGIYGHGMDGGARVATGQHVTEGQVIGLSGNTGGSTGPHLHFETLPDGYVLNSKFYGRMNPESIFTGSLSTAGTITPQEDEMTPEQMLELKLFIQDEIERRHLVTRDLIRAAGFSFDNKVFIQNAVEARALVTRDVVRAAVATLGSVTPGIDAGVLEKALQDAVAKAVADGLAAGVHVDVTVGGK